MSFDIVVIGAGPAGLCFVRSLASTGLRIALVERQQEAALVTPADDGREIAITHRSQRLMHELGLWGRLREDEISSLRDAMVLDGADRDGLMFRHDEAGTSRLGWLLPNHAIRRAFGVSDSPAQFLIRPDGHVGVRSSRARDLEDWLHRVFG